MLLIIYTIGINETKINVFFEIDAKQLDEIKDQKALDTLSCDAYKKTCLNLYRKLRHPNKALIHRPPLKMPPAELMNSFMQDGYMPLTKLW